MSVSGNLTGTYTYDAAGNLTEETTTRHFEWDHANRLTTFRVQTGSATPSKYAQYRYDATGERAVKIVRRGAAQDEITIYVGGFERSLTGSIIGQLTPYDEIHLTDHDTRLAMIQRGAPHPDDGITGQPVRYQVADHLASVTATLDPAGIVLNTEEYLPYGETSFGSYQRKRYRHTGKERDGESGLDYHSARYFAPWLSRWTSTDPIPKPQQSLYRYAADNPLRMIDPSGAQDQPAQRASEPGTPSLNGTASDAGTPAQFQHQGGGGFASGPASTSPPRNSRDPNVRQITAGAQIPQPAPRPSPEEDYLAHRPSKPWDPSPRSPEGAKASLGVPVAQPKLRQFQAPRTEPLSPLERDVEEVKASIHALGVMLKTYFEIADYVTKPAQVVLVVPGAVEVVGGLSLEEVAALEREAARTTTWSRTANTLQDEMALQAAKEGAGEPVKRLQELGDPRYQRMGKVSYVVESTEGRVTEVHYVQDKAGRGTWDPGGPPGREDFKFKRHSDDR
jgi:RHS repeat-associated protein